MLPGFKEAATIANSIFLCPKNETPWVKYFDLSGNVRFIVTSDKAREYYYLYEVGEKQKKLGKSKSPRELEEKYSILSVISKEKKGEKIE